MTTVYNSKFFKGDTRTKSATALGSAYSIAFGSATLNDIFLPAAGCTQLALSQAAQHIILPVVGALSINGETLNPGTIMCYPAADKELSINNLSANDTANYLHISLSDTVYSNSTGKPTAIALDLAAKNTLVVARGLPAIKLGVYDSRVKGLVSPLRANGSLFTYIINGSFEVDGRLMEYRDGLHLWQTGEIDFESLSEAAIILFIDCSLLQ